MISKGADHGIYNSTPPTLTDKQVATLQVDQNGNLKISIVGSAPPSGPAGGDLTGTYPNPTIKPDVALTGNPTTTTQLYTDNSTRISTTAWAITRNLVKESCAYKTIAALPAYTYTSGNITMLSLGAVSIDGVAAVAGVDYLFDQETGGNAPYNGIYRCVAGGGATTFGQFTRRDDFSTAAQIRAYSQVSITSGTQAGTTWQLTTAGPITVGVTSLAFVALLSGVVGVASGGTGLTSGTSGGVPYYASNSTMASSALLASGGVVYGGGTGAAPATNSLFIFDSANLRLSVGIGSNGYAGNFGSTSNNTDGISVRAQNNPEVSFYKSTISRAVVGLAGTANDYFTGTTLNSLVLYGRAGDVFIGSGSAASLKCDSSQNTRTYGSLGIGIAPVAKAHVKQAGQIGDNSTNYLWGLLLENSANTAGYYLGYTSGNTLHAGYFNGSATYTQVFDADTNGIAVGSSTNSGGGNKVIQINGTGNIAFILNKTDATTSQWSFQSGGSGELNIQDVPGGQNVVTIAKGAGGNRLNVDASGNVSLTGAANFGLGVGMLGIPNRTTLPSGTPSGGIVIFSDSGAAKVKGGSGTTTTFGPADPHCPNCQGDFGNEWENDKYGGKVHICRVCEVQYMHRIKDILLRFINQQDISDEKIFLAQDVNYIRWNVDRGDEYQGMVLPMALQEAARAEVLN